MEAPPAPQLFDSLPYYDNDLETHPILREKVQHELAVETQKIQQETLHPRIPPPVELFVVSPSNDQRSTQVISQTVLSEQSSPCRRISACCSTQASRCSRYVSLPVGYIVGTTVQ